MLTKIKKPAAFSLLLDSNFCISIMDPKGHMLYVNKKFCDLTKYKAGELIGNQNPLFSSSFSSATILKTIENDFPLQNVSFQKIKALAKDGSEIILQTTTLPVNDDMDNLQNYISFYIDITEQSKSLPQDDRFIEEINAINFPMSESAIVASTDVNGVITSVSEKLCELSKYSAEELIGQKHTILNVGFHDDINYTDMCNTVSSGHIWNGDIKNRAKDGSYYWVNSTIVPMLNKTGKPYKYIAFPYDITEQKRDEVSLEMALKHDFKQTVSNLQNALFKYKVESNGEISFEFIEGKLAEKFNLSSVQVKKSSKSKSQLNALLAEVRHYLENAFSGTPTQFEYRFKDYSFLVYLSPIVVDSQVINVVGTMIDISQRIETEKIIEHMAYHDYLTNLPNRRLFQLEVNDQINLSKTTDESFAILFVDLDRFKNINDSMGHSIGDQVLIAVATELSNCINEDSIVARHGGDEFVILLPGTCAHMAEMIAQRIMEVLAKPISFSSIDLYVSPSIGISVYPKDGSDYDSLIGNADSALHLAKEKGKNNYQFFNEMLRQDILEKTSLELDLRNALGNNQFSIAYQPQIDLKTGNVNGLEALIRWQHPIKGMIRPIRFISIAEETGMIVPIGQWMLHTACAQTKKWHDEGMHKVQISINVSIHQFKQLTFVEEVREALETTGLEAQFLNLEITESMTSEPEECQETLHLLRKLGVSVSIDDFGTGFSSLSYLSKFPITHLKIDQAFIQELTTSNKAIIKTIINLAKNLDLRVIAEGVETIEQVNFLKKLKCDDVQGFFYSPPLPAEEVQQFIAI